jgi:Spy/CpxP family protein refolding chaperone
MAGLERMTGDVVMTRKHGTMVIGMALTALLLGGCGADVANTVSALQVSRAGSAAVPPQAGERGPGPGMRPVGMPFAQVTLTDEQKAQLKAIADKYKPAAPPANDLRQLLTADTVDETALRSALQAGAAEHKTRQEQELAMRAEIRAIFTDAQRAEIVANLQAAPEPPARPDQAPPADMEAKHAEREAAMATKLGLNDEQKAAVAALKPPAPPSKPDPAAHKAAEIAFWQTGDTSGIQLPAPPDNTEAIVKAALVLTAEQRKVIFGHGFGGPEGGPGGHAGPGSKGPHGGPGDHGGRGPGVPAPEASDSAT